MLRKTILALGLFWLAANSALAADAIRTTWVGNLAVEGYDPVAYFTENKAVKGSKDFEWEWGDANWRFSSEENLAAFKLDPEKYSPQYGGYCAYAVADGKTVGIDPEAFDIVDGKLYLNYSKKIQERWKGDRDNFISKADEVWPTLID